MTIYAIIATGQSLNREDVDYLKGKCEAIAVSNAYKMAPWAKALVSHDRAWWQQNPEAIEFQGLKYCQQTYPGTDRYHPYYLPQGCNSGLMAMFLAKDWGATKLIILGFDMHGTHYFGPHPEPLKNTHALRFKQHIRQFARFSGVPVYNATNGSALERYEKVNLRDVI